MFVRSSLAGLAMGARPRGGWQRPLLAPSSAVAAERRLVWAFGVSAGVSIVRSEKHRGALVRFVLEVQFTLMLSSCDRPRQQLQLFFTARFLCRNVWFFYS